jgi:hypothetical protein
VFEFKVGTASPRAPGAVTLRSASTEGDGYGIGEMTAGLGLEPRTC